MPVTLTAIDRGTVPGDGTGDTPYVAFGKCESNDAALKAAADLVLDVPQNYLLGRISATTGDVEQLTAVQVRSILNVADGATPDQTSIVGITGTKSQFNTSLTDGDFLFVGDTLAWSSITSTPTTLAGYGITDAAPSSHLGGNAHIDWTVTGAEVIHADRYTDTVYTHPATHPWSILTGTPTTLAGYGITDAASDTHNHDADYISIVAIPTTGNFPTLTAGGELLNSAYGPGSFAAASHNHSWSEITSGKPTTLAGYGISDTKANFNTALSDGSFMFSGDAPTAHTHTESEITDLGDYIPAVTTPTLGNFPQLDASGHLVNSAYDETSFDVAGAATSAVSGHESTYNHGNYNSAYSFYASLTASAAELNLLALGGLTAGWALIADSANTASWQPIPAGASTIGDLTDVVITTVGDNELLQYDTATSKWINQTLAEAGVAAASHNHSWANITSGVPTTLAGYGISDTKANFNTACSDGSFLFSGDAVTSVGASTGLSSSGGTAPSISLALTNLTTATTELISTDFVICLDGTAERKITLANFANEMQAIGGWTANTGTVTSISAGSGMTFTTITGSGSVSIDTTQTAITSMYNTSLNVGYSSTVYMDFASTAFSFIFGSVEDFRFSDGGSMLANGNVTAYSSTISSDARLKENVEVIGDPMVILDGIHGYTFNWKRDGLESAGVIAQEVEQVLPRAVRETEDLHDPENTFKVVDYNQLVGVLIEAVKGLKSRVEELELRLEVAA